MPLATLLWMPCLAVHNVCAACGCVDIIGDCATLCVSSRHPCRGHHLDIGIVNLASDSSGMIATPCGWVVGLLVQRLVNLPKIPPLLIHGLLIARSVTRRASA